MTQCTCGAHTHDTTEAYREITRKLFAPEPDHRPQFLPNGFNLTNEEDKK